MNCYCSCHIPIGHSPIASRPACEHCWGTGVDEDVNLMDRTSLRVEVLKLRKAIRLHRDEKGHDRCWLDDQRLYGALSDGVQALTVLPNREEFLANCDRFWCERQENP